MKKIFRTLTYLERIEITTCIFLLAVMSLVVIVQVFSRYVLHYSFVWAEELVRYLMIWMVMIGAALVQATNDHIRIDFVPMLAGPRGRRALETVFRLFTLVLLVVLIWKGVKIAYFNRAFETSGLRITMFWPTMALPIGALLMGIYTAHALVQDMIRLLFWPTDKLVEEDTRLRMQKYEGNPPTGDQDLNQRR